MNPGLIEISKLLIARQLARIQLFRKKQRILRVFYNNLSDRIRGIRTVIPVLNKKYGINMLVNTKDLIGWNLFFFGEYEKDTNRILERFVSNEDIVIEAGANIGSETLLLGKLCPKGKVYAFEPAPQVYGYLQFNIGLNHLLNIHSYQMALGEKEKDIEFYLLPEHFPNQGMSSKIRHTQAEKKIIVRQTTINRFVEEHNIQRLELIKMDIQGAEYSVLEGAENVIRKFKPNILLEASESYSDLTEIFKYLEKFGYLVYLITPGAELELIKKENLVPGNWWCTNR